MSQPWKSYPNSAQPVPGACCLDSEQSPGSFGVNSDGNAAIRIMMSAIRAATQNTQLRRRSRQASWPRLRAFSFPVPLTSVPLGTSVAAID